MKKYLLKTISLITCFTIVLLTFIGCGNNSEEEKHPTVETDNLIITYNGTADKNIDMGLYNPNAEGYQFKLKIENKTDKKIEYRVNKIIVNDVTIQLEQIDEVCHGTVGAHEKQGDNVGVIKDRLTDADIDINKIKKIELFMIVAEPDQKKSDGSDYFLGISDENYPLLESPKIVFEF